jgi:SagB-type dehydrogenase family enzyme
MALEDFDETLLNEQSDLVWELFHENSKLSRFERHPTYGLRPSDAMIVDVMKRLRTVKAYRDYPKVPLPTRFPRSKKGFDDVLENRTTARQFGQGAMGLDELAKVLYMSYGITRSNADTHFPRPFRTIPSGGALYPLELYVYASRVDGLAAGLYHYDMEEQSLDVIRQGDESARISACLVQGDLAKSAALILFISAIFFRSTFKYGDRGYRFVLLEAGHLAQNANLTAQEMGLVTANIGGYADRDIDRYLGFDGLSESTIYILLIGQPEAHRSDAVNGEGNW